MGDLAGEGWLGLADRHEGKMQITIAVCSGVRNAPSLPGTNENGMKVEKKKNRNPVR